MPADGVQSRRRSLCGGALKIRRAVKELQKLTAQDNSSIKLYRKLTVSKKTRRETGLFVLEGQRLVRDALQNGAELTHLFWTEAGFSAWRTRPELLDQIPQTTQTAMLSDGLGKALSQTEHSQGVYAICRMLSTPPFADFFQAGGAYAILYQLQDPGNVGMILRTADALGLDGVVCCGCCDIYSPKTVRATMGSLFRIPVSCTSEIQPLLKICRERKIETCAAVLDVGAEMVGRCRFSAQTAVLIGNEGNGLPPEIAAACDRRLMIPMHGSIESLNAAMAAGIILWEVKRGIR